MVGGSDGRISDQAGMPKNGMSCLPIASGSRLVAHGSPSKSETLALGMVTDVGVWQWKSMISSKNETLGVKWWEWWFGVEIIYMTMERVHGGFESTSPA